MGGRLTEDDDFTYAYDANGNLTSKTAKVGGAVTTYAYDASNRLTSVTRPDTSVVSYRYDALGRMIERDDAGAVTRYVHDGPNVALELDGANAVTARFVHNPGVFDEILAMERGGSWYGYLTDHQGSVLGLVDATGALVNEYSYDAFGVPLGTPVEAVANPFRYAGRPWDGTVGLYDMRARHYDPALGRFIQPDPKGYGGGDGNLYSYASSSPLNLTDPSGENPNDASAQYVRENVLPGVIEGAYRSGLDIRGKAEVELHERPGGGPPRLTLRVRLDEDGNPLPRRGEDPERRAAASLLVIDVYQRDLYGRRVWWTSARTVEIGNQRIVDADDCQTTEEYLEITGGRPAHEWINDPDNPILQRLLRSLPDSPEEAASQALFRLGVSDGRVNHATMALRYGRRRR